MKIRIRFDDGPGPVGGRFIDVEDSVGKGISVGEWVFEPLSEHWFLEIETDLREQYEDAEKRAKGWKELLLLSSRDRKVIQKQYNQSEEDNRLLRHVRDVSISLRDDLFNGFKRQGEELSKLRNENILLRAEVDGAGSVMLDLQQECIKYRTILNDFVTHANEVLEDG